jgi:hypothetical protein
LREPIVTPSDNLREFKNQVTFEGVKPVAPTRNERFAILLEPLGEQAIGRGVVAGVTPVLLNVVRETDPFAEVVEEETQHLRTSATGQTVLRKSAHVGGRSRRQHHSRSADSAQDRASWVGGREGKMRGHARPSARSSERATT